MLKHFASLIVLGLIGLVPIGVQASAIQTAEDAVVLANKACPGLENRRPGTSLKTTFTKGIWSIDQYRDGKPVCFVGEGSLRDSDEGISASVNAETGEISCYQCITLY